MKPMDIMEALGDVPQELVQKAAAEPQAQSVLQPGGRRLPAHQTGAQSGRPVWFQRTAAVTAAALCLAAVFGSVYFVRRLKQDSLQSGSEIAAHSETTGAVQTLLPETTAAAVDTMMPETTADPVIFPPDIQGETTADPAETVQPESSPAVTGHTGTTSAGRITTAHNQNTTAKTTNAPMQTGTTGTKPTEPTTSKTTSAATTTTTSFYDLREHEPTEQELKTRAVLDAKLNKGSKAGLTRSYPTADLLNYIDYGNASENIVTFLYALDEKFPVEYLASDIDASPYCIYRLDEGGYAYVFFNTCNSLWEVDYVFITDEHLLDASALAGIQPGMTLADVEAADPGTKRIDAVRNQPMGLRTSLHLTKTGAYMITYSLPADVEDNHRLVDERVKTNPEQFMVEGVYFFEEGSAKDIPFGHSMKYFYGRISDFRVVTRAEDK